MLRESESMKKRLKLFEYLQNTICNNGFIVSQETHSSIKDKQKWKDDFKGPLFLHGKTNSFGVVIGFLQTRASKMVSKVCNQNKQILILDVVLNNAKLLLIDF